MDKTIAKYLSNTEWQVLADRREEILGLSITSFAYKYFSQATGLPKLLTSELWLQGMLYNKKEDRTVVREYFAKFPIGSIYKFIDRMMFYLNELEQQSVFISKCNLALFKQKELSLLVKQYINTALLTHNFLAIIPAIDGAIASRIENLLPTTDVEQKHKWLGELVYPSKENFYILEEKSFYKLVKLYSKKDKAFASQLKKHLNSFAWIGARQYHFYNAWTEESVLSRINDFVSAKKNADKETKRLKQVIDERKAMGRKLISKLRLGGNKKFLSLIKLARDLAYLRTYRTDIIYRSHYVARELYYEIGRRAGVSERDILCYNYAEVLKLAQDPKSVVSLAEIKSRKEAVATLYWNGKHYIFSGKKEIGEMKKLIGYEEVKKTASVVGKTAHPGCVKGKVKIVLGPQDLGKVERGDILVAIMTFPDFVPAMERAAAFVTNEGGILCHAAIISREMKKPCVINTRVATQVFKDGDFVEVDANTGVVKIIK